MQEHEKTLLTLIVIGGLIGMSKLLVSTEKLTFLILLTKPVFRARGAPMSPNEAPKISKKKIFLFDFSQKNGLKAA